MGFIFLIVAGCALGWLFTIALNSDQFGGAGRNMAAGVAGSLLAGLLIGPWAGGGSLLEGSYSVEMIVFSAIGALAAVFSANLDQIRHHQ